MQPSGSADVVFCHFSGEPTFENTVSELLTHAVVQSNARWLFAGSRGKIGQPK